MAQLQTTGVTGSVFVTDKIGIGTLTPIADLHVSGSNATSIIDGLRIGRGAGDVVKNTIVGSSSLVSNTTGTNNSAFGFKSLQSNTSGVGNSSFGVNTLTNN